MKRRTGAAMLGLALCLAMTGCGDQATGAAGGDAEVRTQAEGNVESIQDEAGSEEAAVKEPDYYFGNEIVAHDRDTFNVEGLYDVTVDSIYSGYDAVYAQIKIKTPDKEFTHTVWRNEAGFTEYTNSPTEVPPYIIEMPKSIVGEATFILKERVFPEPVILSGNPEDVYTFEDYSYCVGDNVVLYFDKDATVNGDALILVEQVYKDLEEKTGLKFKNDSKYGNFVEYGVREAYFDCDPFNGYDYYHKDRMGVYFIVDHNNNDWISCSFGAKSLVMMGEDGDFHNESLYILAHEMAHSLDRANHDNFDRVLTEGFGSYWGSQIAKDYPEYIVGDRAEWGPTFENYWGMPELINAKNAEKLFNAEFDRMENSSYYEYGYQLMTYFYENYTLDEINAFYDALSERLWDKRLAEDEYAEMNMAFGLLGDVSTQEFETAFLKEYWGDDFFEKFGAWDKQNAKRFSW